VFGLKNQKSIANRQPLSSNSNIGVLPLFISTKHIDLGLLNLFFTPGRQFRVSGS
jgi:hypothetical protein